MVKNNIIFNKYRSETVSQTVEGDTAKYDTVYGSNVEKMPHTPKIVIQIS